MSGAQEKRKRREMDAVQGFDFEVMAGGYGNADRGH
jgi:hypothetical protein